MTLKKGTVYILVANIINLIISLFTGFVLPKFLSVESYSNIKLFQLYIAYIGVISLGYADGMYLRLGGKNIKNLDVNEIKNEFATYKLFQFIATLVLLLISFLIKNQILFFCSLVILPVNIAGYLKNMYQATGKFDLYSRFMNINTLLLFAVNVFLILIIKTDNYYVYIVCYILAYFLYWLYVELETRKIIGNSKARIEFNYFRNDIKNGFFLMIGNFCGVIFTSIDRLFVQNILGTIKFAFYSFAVSVENLMHVFITPISSVMYNYLCNYQTKEKVVKIKRLILLFSAIIIILIFPAKFVINFWLDKYSESLNVLFLLFAAQYISIMIRCIHTNLYKAKKEQNKYFITMSMIVALSVILNIILYLILKNMESFAIATLITNIIWFIIGELKFKEYRLRLMEYIYVFAVMIVFLLSGTIDSAIIGCLVYSLITFLLSFICMNTSVNYCIMEIVQIIKQKNK